MPFEPHEGEVALEHTFRQACGWLERHGPKDLRTSRDTPFQAMVSDVQRGAHRGEKVIRFVRDRRESARAYECCWGHYYNCYGTRIGMYCMAVDGSVS